MDQNFGIKFKNYFNYVNYAKLIFSCNKLPEAKDDTSAFFRRWILINFPYTFEGVNCDKKILEKLTTEKELSIYVNEPAECMWDLEDQEYDEMGYTFSCSKKAFTESSFYSGLYECTTTLTDLPTDIITPVKSLVGTI